MRKSMGVIRPTDITDAMFVSSTVAENDYAPWVSGTTYAIGDKRIRVETHRIYERQTAGAGTIAPESDTTNWVDIGPTNRWAMFDNVVGTKTSGTSALTVVLTPGNVSGMALMELVGDSATITMKDMPNGSVAYSRTITLDGSLISDIFDWFFQPHEQLTDFVLTDLPFQFPSCELTISVTGEAAVSCGVCKVGELIPIGGTQAGATSGITDFSTKTKDVFGNYTVVERAFSKRMSLKVVTDACDYNRVSRSLASLRAKPCVYIGSYMAGYEPLVVYGFFKDFSIDVAYTTAHYCSLEVEGLI